MSIIERPVIERFTSLNDRFVTLSKYMQVSCLLKLVLTRTGVTTFIFSGFLCVELIVARKGSKKSKQKSKKSQITADLTDHLKRACLTLNMPRPPPDIDASKLLSLLFKSVSSVKVLHPLSSACIISFQQPPFNKAM